MASFGSSKMYKFLHLDENVVAILSHTSITTVRQGVQCHLCSYTWYWNAMFMAFLWCCSIHGCMKEITLSKVQRDWDGLLHSFTFCDSSSQLWKIHYSPPHP